MPHGLQMPEKSGTHVLHSKKNGTNTTSFTFGKHSYLQNASSKFASNPPANASQEVRGKKRKGEGGGWWWGGCGLGTCSSCSFAFRSFSDGRERVMLLDVGSSFERREIQARQDKKAQGNAILEKKRKE